MSEPLTPFQGDEGAPQPESAADARAVAEYLGDMIGQLESLARAQGFDLIVYLLSMARVEAETTAREAGSRRWSAG